MSPEEHIVYVKWVRGVAALYGSVALLTVIGFAALQHRSNGPEAQIVNLQRHAPEPTMSHWDAIDYVAPRP